MDAHRKSYEIQAQVRHNAEEFKNTLSDLYNWQKEIKENEKKVETQIEENNIVSTQVKSTNARVPEYQLPIRSHVGKANEKKSIFQPDVKKSLKEFEVNELDKKKQNNFIDANEKSDSTLDMDLIRRKKANEIKENGNRLVKNGQYDKAIEVYTMAIKLEPNDAIFYSNRALCYLKLEKFFECIEDCDRATNIDETNVKAYYRRMLANESLGNNMKALKDCTIVLNIEPKNIEAKRSLARINELLKPKVQSGPNFSTLCSNMIDIKPIVKPPNKRSNKPLYRVPITDVVLPNYDRRSDQLQISDEDIDHIFNSHCGTFEEIKDTVSSSANNDTSNATIIKKPVAPVASSKPNIPIFVNNDGNKIIRPVNDRKLSPDFNQAKKAKNDDNFKLSQTVNDQYTMETKYKEDDNDELISIDGDLEYENELSSDPITTAQFYKNWKTLADKQRYNYLQMIPIEKLNKILGAGFDSETFTGIINIIKDYYIPNKNSETAKLLIELSNNRYMSILSLLKTSDDEEALMSFINYLKECNEIDVQTALCLQKKFVFYRMVSKSH